MVRRSSLVLLLLSSACGGDVFYFEDTDVPADEVLDDEAVVPPVTAPAEDDGCPAIAPAALVVTATDAGGAALCDATVTVADGTFARIAQKGGPPDACVYFAVFERAGTYAVTVAHPGYLSVVRDGIAIALDDCGHAITVHEEVALSAGEDPPAVDPDLPIDDEEDPPVDEEDPVIPDPDLDPPVTAPACPDGLVAHVGDVVAAAADDLDVLAGVECLSGTLTVAAGVSSVALPALERVTGDVVLDDAAALETLDLPSLEVVEGDLTIRGTDLTTLAGLDALLAVGGTLTLEGNAALTNGDLVVVSVGGLAIRDHAGLPRARLRSLSSVGEILVEDNPDLDDLDLRAVVEVSGDARFASSAFGDLDLRALTSVAGSLTLEGTTALPDLDQLAELATVGGDLAVRDNAELAADDVAAFVDGIDVGGAVTTCGNAGEAACP